MALPLRHTTFQHHVQGAHVLACGLSHSVAVASFVTQPSMCYVLLLRRPKHTLGSPALVLLHGRLRRRSLPQTVPAPLAGRPSWRLGLPATSNEWKRLGSHVP